MNIFESGTDYVVETQSAHLAYAKELNIIIFEQMERESGIIINALESMSVVLEEVQNANADATNDKRSVFSKMIDFIKKIVTMFTDKVKALVQRDAAWIEENEKAFDKVNYDGLEINMIQFWKINEQTMTASTSSVNSKILDASKADIGPFKDMESTKKHPAVAQYLDAEGDLANGIKNFLRTGNAKDVAKAEPLKGDAIKERIQKEFLPYCKNYSTAILPAITKESNDIQQKLSILEKTLKQKIAAGDKSHEPAPAEQKQEPVKDSFCMIENAPYGETDLIYCENFIVLEAGQPAANNTQQTQATPQEAAKPATPAVTSEKKVAPTKVQVTDHGSKENSDFHDKVSNMSSADLTAYRNVISVVQTILSALMTVCEERYVAYMNALKQIMSARKPAADTTTKNNTNTTAKVELKASPAKK